MSTNPYEIFAWCGCLTGKNKPLDFGADPIRDQDTEILSGISTTLSGVCGLRVLRSGLQSGTTGRAVSSARNIHTTVRTDAINFE